jgi:hypothetical protein
MGNVGRNVLRGPRRSNLDFSLGKRFPLTESKSLEFHADLFNLLNHPSRDNPSVTSAPWTLARLLSLVPVRESYSSR